MATTKINYGAKSSPTITLAGLASGAAAVSSTITNSSAVDFLLGGKFTNGAAGVSSTGTIQVYAAASAGNSGDLPGNVGDMTLLATIQANTNSNTYYLDAKSIAAAYGGVLPQYLKIYVVNNTGAALDATAGNHGLWYTSISIQTV